MTSNPQDTESKIYAEWENQDCFRPLANAKPSAKSFCIVLPPPNITGDLHIGHALNCTLQDVLVRWHRMRGFDTLWQPGLDHAGIATQMVVERKLLKDGKPARKDMSREEFLQHVWQWKEKSKDNIKQQMQKLGCSCDWSRERFTLDEGMSQAVRTAFVKLFNDGLIYQAEHLVNWDPHFETALSDLEVEHIETEGTMYYLRYPFDASTGFVEIATTRPETLFGDVALAVNPKDPKNQHIINRWISLPLTYRRIQILADDHVDPELGSGILKVTPAHDFHDFEIGKRAQLTPIKIFDSKARMDFRNVTDIPTETSLALHGLDRLEARAKILQMLEDQGFLIGTAPHKHLVPHGDRSKTPIEPYLTQQWFVDAKALAKPAIQAIQEGKTRFVPKNWENTYFHWMENIKPWCISRQLWWGHQIPVWTGPDGKAFAAISETEAQEMSKSHYGKDVTLVQDPDVLDTWFSSALWPLSTLGWPEETPELRNYYPTGVLVTAFDIIFFWVARMMMFGLYFRNGEIPFQTIHVHGIIRDKHGNKMSKSLGNVLDPIPLIEKYGADALRCTLLALASQNQDIRLSESRIEGYRNFVTKIRNAARFVEMQDCGSIADFNPKKVQSPINRWIVGQIAGLNAEIDQALDEHRFDTAIQALYSTTKNVFCDWYLELAKPDLQEKNAVEIRQTLAWSLEQILLLAHPFLPFVTESLWNSRNGLLIQSDWPILHPETLKDPAADKKVGLLIEFIESIRSLKERNKISGKPKILLATEDKDILSLLSHFKPSILRLGRISALDIQEFPLPESEARESFEKYQISLGEDAISDLDPEQARKQLAKLAKQIQQTGDKLVNLDFMRKAPANVVQAHWNKLHDFMSKRDTITESLENQQKRLDKDTE